VTVAFMLLWLAGWAVLLAAAVEGFGRWDAESVLRLFLVALGPLVLIPLVWVAFGKRESLTLSPGALLIERRAGPLTLRRSLEPLAIRDIRASPVVEGLLADLAAIRFFYSGGNGRVAIHTDANSISVGHQISERDASGLIDSLMPFLPHIATRPSEERFGNPPFAWRATAIMTMIMLWFALTVPVKLAITDRKTCFPDDDVRPSTCPPCVRRAACTWCRSTTSRWNARGRLPITSGGGSASPSTSPRRSSGRWPRTTCAAIR
jgi:hypothetical protein